MSSDWYKDAIFYEVYVRGFYDSSGDGVGDFRGLTSKLDYLQWLGITCIWLLPFYESPLHRRADSIAIAKINIVAHSDLVAVIQERTARKTEQQGVQ